MSWARGTDPEGEEDWESAWGDGAGFAAEVTEEPTSSYTLVSLFRSAPINCCSLKGIVPFT